MAQPFTPLSTPGSTPGTPPPEPAGRVQAPARPAAQAGFTPMQVSLPQRGAAAGPSCGQPRVTLDRDKERITGIRIECPCGQVIDLECSY